jgi:molecular chaperone DnaJ
MKKDYYKILGINHSASPEEIKEAFYRLARQYHPHRAGKDEKKFKELNEKFKEINEAYQVLSDKQKRTQYDQFGQVFKGASVGGGEWPFGFDFSAQGETSPFWGGDFESGFGDLSDLGEIFDTFFEGLGVRPRRRTYRRGSDIEVAQKISLEEAFKGTRKNLEYQTLITCEKCQGIGYDKKEGVTVCSTCGGRGEIRENQRTFFGSFSRNKVCPECGGFGEVPKKVCSECRGSGRLSGMRKVAVDIIPGVADNQIIKIKGIGEAGERGSQTGDLYVRIKEISHSIFRREGDDLYLKQDLKLTEALLGKKIKIKDLSGEFFEVELPPGFNFKEKLRVAGRGMPHLHGSGRGALYLEFDLKLPKKVSDKAKKIIEDLDREI